mgnify:CR=1 FL=1
MTDRWLMLALRLTGTDPSRVRGLVAALRAEVRGQKALQYEARGRRGLHPDTGRVLLLVVLGLLSVGVAVGVGMLGERPLVAATLMVLVCVFVFAAASAATPAAVKATAPVSSGPISAASVSVTWLSLAVPEASPDASAFAPAVANPLKTKSPAATVPSFTGSEKVTSTVVVVTVEAETIAGPAASVAFAGP